MMTRTREDVVKDFHHAFGHPVDRDLTQKELSLRYELLYEELQEVKEEVAAAMADVTTYGHITTKTKSRLLKEVADLQYVLSGLAVALGLPLQVAFNRVHKSNMSKLGEDGKAIFREDGKVLKGPNYAPPYLDDLVHDERNNQEYK